jgi:hypothetical protein
MRFCNCVAAGIDGTASGATPPSAAGCIHARSPFGKATSRSLRAVEAWRMLRAGRSALACEAMLAPPERIPAAADVVVAAAVACPTTGACAGIVSGTSVSDTDCRIGSAAEGGIAADTTGTPPGTTGTVAGVGAGGVGTVSVGTGGVEGGVEAVTGVATGAGLGTGGASTVRGGNRLIGST